MTEQTTFMQDAVAGFAAGETDFTWVGGVKNVYREIKSEHRWYNRVFEVYERDGETIGVEYDEPATEIQEGQDLNGRAFPVKSVEVTVTKYEEATND